LLEKVAFATLREQRAKRRWGIFFKLAGLAYLIALPALLMDWGDSEQLADRRHTAVIHLRGTIEAQGEASAQNLNDALEAAFADKRTAGVVLRVNSPGGSPVQAGIVHDEILRLRTVHPQIPLYAVVEDVCASGGYYVAVAADKIFVDKASIVGSIGVLMDAFGFTGTMEKLGIERRLLTAGENKGFLDPFSPQDLRQTEHAQVLLREIHQQFIEVVRRGRGDRLRETPDLFSGLMWTGSQSIVDRQPEYRPRSRRWFRYRRLGGARRHQGRAAGRVYGQGQSCRASCKATAGRYGRWCVRFPVRPGPALAALRGGQEITASRPRCQPRAGP